MIEQITETAAMWQRIADYNAHMMKGWAFQKRPDLVAFYEHYYNLAVDRNSQLLALLEHLKAQ